MNLQYQKDCHWYLLSYIFGWRKVDVQSVGLINEYSHVNFKGGNGHAMECQLISMTEVVDFKNVDIKHVHVIMNFQLFVGIH